MPEVKNVSSFEVLDGHSSEVLPCIVQTGIQLFAISSGLLTTDEYYASTYGIALLAGNFTRRIDRDSTKIVINETQSKALGWGRPDDAIGQQVKS